MRASDSAMSNTEISEHLLKWFSRPYQGDSSVHDALNSVVIGTSLGQRSENQDYAIFCRGSYSNQNKSFELAILCDGIGGLSHGGETARRVIAYVVTFLNQVTDQIDLQALIKAVSSANEKVFRQYKGLSGCTLSAVLSYGSGIVATNAGDSRIFLLTSSSLTQLSTDDTFAARVPQVDGEVHNPEMSHLLQYIGVGSHLQLPLIDVPTLEGDSALLLASDGVHGIGSKLLESLWRFGKTRRVYIERLLSLAEWVGEHDNATALVLSGFSGNSSFSNGVNGILEVFDANGSLEILQINANRVEEKAQRKRDGRRQEPKLKSQKSVTPESESSVQKSREIPSPTVELLFGAEREEEKDGFEPDQSTTDQRNLSSRLVETIVSQ